MKITQWTVAIVLGGIIFCSWGCGKSSGGGSVDLQKPTKQVQAEAQKMNVDELKAQAEVYKKELAAKKVEAEELEKKLNEIPVTQMLGSEAGKLKDQISALATTTSKVSERLNIYIEELKKKNVDVSALEAK